VSMLERSLAGLAGTGHRLERLRTQVELARTLRLVGRPTDADAVASPAREQAAAIGAETLTRQLAAEAT
jgi:hypothetical protein